MAVVNEVDNDNTMRSGFLDNEEIFEGIDVGCVLGQVSSNPEADNNSP